MQKRGIRTTAGFNNWFQNVRGVTELKASKHVTATSSTLGTRVWAHCSSDALGSLERGEIAIVRWSIELKLGMGLVLGLEVEFEMKPTARLVREGQG